MPPENDEVMFSNGATEIVGWWSADTSGLPTRGAIRRFFVSDDEITSSDADDSKSEKTFKLQL